MQIDGSGQRKPSLTSVLVGITSLAVVMAVLITTIFYSLPSNVLSARDGSKIRRLSVELAQQSWVFFTRPPSYNEFQPFNVEQDGSVVSALEFPQSNPSNFFGIKRTQRAQGPEMANIVNTIDDWFDCRSMPSMDDCASAALDDAKQRISVINTSTAPTICGPILMVESEPVRWVFRNEYDEKRLPVRAVALEVNCSGSA
ncbi:SdpA family antimicrobial peptide system protein [Kineococcus sp. LSe6-4]|uniref:SdpA family antimicrobial peptide system protein n=1 Tax=Kineococcus halophytocola TaxID=3234027 RepID=A0ABV4H610_9ACTN